VTLEQLQLLGALLGLDLASCRSSQLPVERWAAHPLSDQFTLLLGSIEPEELLDPSCVGLLRMQEFMRRDAAGV